jgi:hypothetical protein
LNWYKVLNLVCARALGMNVRIAVAMTIRALLTLSKLLLRDIDSSDFVISEKRRGLTGSRWCVNILRLTASSRMGVFEPERRVGLRNVEGLLNTAGSLRGLSESLALIAAMESAAPPKIRVSQQVATP